MAGKDHLPELKEGQSAWVCEFCGQTNIVEIEPEEVPETDGVNYILESAVQAKEEALGGKKGGPEDISVVFCIDVSGSMCIAKPLKGKHALRGDRIREL